jgi:ABC-type uncharacterized transport system substrate-binding protein
MKKAGLSSILIAVVLLAVAVIAEAQQPTKVPRIAYLTVAPLSANVARVEAFREGLRELGYMEGKNIVIEWRSGEGKLESEGELVAEAVRLKVDVIVTSGPTMTRAAKQATATIPIVMTFDSDPVENGFIASLARPGGNITGLSALSPELSGKQLELLKEKATTTIPIVMTNTSDPVGLGLVASLARPGGNVTGFSSLSPEVNTKRLELLKDAVPRLSRVGLLRELGSGAELQLKELRAAAPALKLKLEEIETQFDAQGLEIAFQTAKQKQVRAIITTTNRSIFVERKRIVELASKYRLPAIYFSKEFVDEGGLMSYGEAHADMFRRSAHYVDKILKGTKPADLPVEQPTKFEFIINLKAAKQIGLTIPPNVLARADKVIR